MCPQWIETHSDVCCEVPGSMAPFNIFAHRTFTHTWGRVATIYHRKKGKGSVSRDSIRMIRAGCFGNELHFVEIVQSTGSVEEVGRGGPHWPQLFYDMGRSVHVEPGDTLMARCTFDSSNTSHKVIFGTRSYITYKRIERFIFIHLLHSGLSHHHEMCSIFLMYYTDRDQGSGYHLCPFSPCRQDHPAFPADSDQFFLVFQS